MQATRKTQKSKKPQKPQKSTKTRVGSTSDKQKQLDFKIDNKTALAERHAAFAQRLTEACDKSGLPPLRQGRLKWILAELAKVGHEIEMETASKWFKATTEPRPPKMEALAKILGVDLMWLQTGSDPNRTPREQRARDATADGVVNLVAGLVRMDGATPIFPADDDSLAKRENIDIYATIKALQYRLHVTSAEPVDGGLRFALPARVSEVIVIGVERLKDFAFRLYEVPASLIEELGDNRGGSILLTVDDPKTQLKTIKSFAERL